MTPQEELQQIYKEGIEIDLREDRSYTEECENFDIYYSVENRVVTIIDVAYDSVTLFDYKEIEKLEDFLTESNQKDWGISDAEEFGNINY